MKTYQIVETTDEFDQDRKCYVIDVKVHLFGWSWWKRLMRTVNYCGVSFSANAEYFDTIEEAKEYLKEIYKPSKPDKTIEIINYD